MNRQETKQNLISITYSLYNRCFSIIYYIVDPNKVVIMRVYPFHFNRMVSFRHEVFQAGSTFCPYFS